MLAPQILLASQLRRRLHFAPRVVRPRPLAPTMTAFFSSRNSTKVEAPTDKNLAGKASIEAETSSDTTIDKAFYEGQTPPRKPVTKFRRNVDASSKDDDKTHPLITDHAIPERTQETDSMTRLDEAVPNSDQMIYTAAQLDQVLQRMQSSGETKHTIFEAPESQIKKWQRYWYSLWCAYIPLICGIPIYQEYGNLAAYGE